MQKPTLCICTRTHVHEHARVHYTPMGIYCYLFLSCDVEVSYVSNHQKQALVNAIKYVCALTL